MCFMVYCDWWVLGPYREWDILFVEGKGATKLIKLIPSIYGSTYGNGQFVYVESSYPSESISVFLDTKVFFICYCSLSLWDNVKVRLIFPSIV